MAFTCKTIEEALKKALIKELQARNRLWTFIPHAPIDLIETLNHKLSDMQNTLSSTNMVWADLIEKIVFAPKQADIILNTQKLIQLLAIDPHSITDDPLILKAPLTIKKRGVETKVIMGAQSINIDPVLIKNIAIAKSWYEQIKQGASLEETAMAHKVQSSRIRQMIDLAFLSPEMIKLILAGQQPVGLTSQCIKSNSLPPCGHAQNKLLQGL